MNPQGRRMGQFVVSVDPKGSLAFSGPVLARRGRPAAHVSQAVTEQVDPAFIVGRRAGQFGAEALIQRRGDFKRLYPELTVDPVSLDEIMVFMVRGESK